MPGGTELLHRQLAILRACAGDGPQRFSSLRGRLGVPASTLARMLRGLAAADLVRSAGGAYALAPGATRLALELLGQQRPAGAAEEVVAALARQTGASAAFWILDAGRLILAAKHEVDGGFRFLERFAHRTPTSSAFGIVIIAAHPEASRAPLLRGSGAAVRRLVRDTAGAGAFAGCLDSEPGVWRVAVPVVAGGSVAGAIGVSRRAAPGAAASRRDAACARAAARRLASRLEDDAAS